MLSEQCEVLCFIAFGLCLMVFLLDRLSPPLLTADHDALSTVLAPTRPASYYLRQADLYFDSLELRAFAKGPAYHDKVIRWEWPPWLVLTGFTKLRTVTADEIIRLYPCVCVERQHRFLTEQPFVRSVVTFYYGNDVHQRSHPVRIYEEFTFDSSGLLTFIEAWSAQSGGRLPRVDESGWPLGDVTRLSTKVPSLGSQRGFNIRDPTLLTLAAKDADLRELVHRCGAFYESVVETAARSWLLRRGETGKRSVHVGPLNEASLITAA